MTDESPAQLDWVAAEVKRLAWDNYNIMLAPGDEARTKRERHDAAEESSFLTASYFTPDPMTIQEYKSFGPRR